MTTVKHINCPATEAGKTKPRICKTCDQKIPRVSTEMKKFITATPQKEGNILICPYCGLEGTYHGNHLEGTI